MQNAIRIIEKFIRLSFETPVLHVLLIRIHYNCRNNIQVSIEMFLNSQECTLYFRWLDTFCCQTLSPDTGRNVLCDYDGGDCCIK